MKNNIILVGILLLIGFSSCEKYIDDTKSWGTMSDDVVFKNADLMELYVNGFYSVIPGDTRSRYFSEENCGDRAQLMSMLSGKVDGAAFTPGDGNLYDWIVDRRMPDSWSTIRSINKFLERVDKSEAVFEINEKNWLKGQAYFFRAFCYYQLVEVFGGVPIITVAQDPLAPAETLNLPRNSSLECFDFIEHQLDSAIQLLPIRGTKGYAAHRIDKFAAMAMKSKALVIKATPRFCNTKVDKYWQDAYDVVIATKAEVNAAGFGLYPNNVQMWIDHKARNTEFLFYKPFEYPLSGGGQTMRPGSAGGGTASTPAWQHVQAYPMANGKNIEDAGSGYDEEMYWANRDPRFYENLSYTGALWEFPDFPGHRMFMFSGASNVKGNDAGTNPPMGFTQRKKTDQSLTLVDYRIKSTVDWAIIRYTELLLWQAECANEINKSFEAFEQLVLIRERAGIEPGTDGRYGLNPGVGSDYKLTLDAIMKERQIEFAFEGQRFWDYVNRNNFKELRDFERFERYVPKLNVEAFNALKFKKRGTNEIINITGDIIPYTDVINALTDALNNAPSKMEENEIIKAVCIFEKGVYDADQKIEIPDYYVFGPIYQGDINKSPALKQNIGWPGGTFDPRITK